MRLIDWELCERDKDGKPIHHGRFYPDGEGYGGFEVFRVGESKVVEPGWYWDTFNRRGWRDSSFHGPFETALDAFNAAVGR